MVGRVKLSPLKMAVLGLGWFGTHFFWGFNTGSIPLFLRHFTGSKFMISLVLSLAGVMGATVPFIVGHLSDRTASRLGRRRPYVLAGMMGALLCLLILPSTPTFGVAALAAGFLYLSIRLGETPYMALLPDITPIEQRSTTSGVVHLFGSVGTVTFFLISSRLWDMSSSAVFHVVALVYFCSLSIAIICIREPHLEKKAPVRTDGAVEYLRSVLRETNALRFFVAEFFWWLSFYMVSSFMTLFVAEELGASEGDSLLVPMAFSLMVILFMLPLGMLGDRLGRKKVLSWMIALWAVIGLCIGFTQNFIQALIVVGASGIPFAAVMGVGYAYLLDLIPGDRTGEFVGMSVMTIAIAQICGSVIGGKLIDSLGYRSIFPGAATFMVFGLIWLQFTHPPAIRSPQSQIRNGWNR